MEVRFVYDETALWIGARMRSDNGGAIQAPMSRRDNGDQAEYLQIELDTYHDRRTAYMFGVTASGVRLDHFHPDRQPGRHRPGVRPGVAGEDRRRRPRLDRRDVAAVLAAPLQRCARAGLGAQPEALASHAERGGLLGRRRPHGDRVGVAIR